MDPNVFFYSSSWESEDDSNIAAKRRNIPDKRNPFSLPEVGRVRLSKAAFEYVLAEINILGKCQPTSVPPILQLVTTLTLLASGSFQHNAGYDFLVGLAQSTRANL